MSNMIKQRSSTSLRLRNYKQGFYLLTLTGDSHRQLTGNTEMYSKNNQSICGSPLLTALMSPSLLDPENSVLYKNHDPIEDLIAKPSAHHVPLTADQLAWNARIEAGNRERSARRDAGRAAREGAQNGKGTPRRSALSTGGEQHGKHSFSESYGSSPSGTKNIL
jgi:hypothetical protein